ncbi:hypothetical protein COU53_00360 [Candidatus Pacearchaeota archaeon CG10_big_fil_rev_8_21_14_0_10_30_48]|nr:MAG: hypothetical protein COU53_00360 [Candidatus Pacearchaeota archaeon CG10_big_fil_rev_8_21_14_0_10_30_48]
MKPIILASKKDPAGMNIVENLKKINCQIPIHLVETEIIHAENIDKKFDTDFIIFASKHQSQIPNKTLSVHTIGNFKEAEYGGKSNTLSPASALLSKHFFQTLNKNNNSDYKVTLEVTHHGPLIEIPSIFIEIGSTKSEWEDKKAGELIAKTIIESINSFKKESYKIAIGIGGPHYCPSFNKIQLEDKFAISHIVPKYGLPLTKNLVKQLINKTQEKLTHAIIDWKGFTNSHERQEVIENIESFGLQVLRTSDAK